MVAQRGVRFAEAHPAEAAILAVIAGLAVGLLLTLFDLPSWDEAQRERARESKQFRVWVGLVCAQTTFLVLAAVPLLAMVRRYRQGVTRPLRQVVPAALLLTLLVLFINLIAVAATPHGVVPAILPHQRLKGQLMGSVGLIALLIVASSMLLIRVHGLTLGTSGKVTADDLRRYLRLRSDLERLLAYFGVLIGFSVLSQVALRALIRDELDARSFAETPISSVPVVVTGIGLSLVLALVYIPCFATLQGVGSRLREAAAPLLDPSDPDFERGLSKRAALTELLELRISATGSFRAAVVILTPLLAGLISLLLSKVAGK